MSERHFDTAAVHAGSLTIPSNRSSSPALFQASSYEFADLADVEAVYTGERPGRIYGRCGGPNALQFESAMAELEDAEAAVGAAAGMAAIDAALVTNLRPGDAVVATREMYGGTYTLLENDYRERGFRVVYVDQQDLEAVNTALERERPKVLYVEALTNPFVHVADLARLAGLAHGAGSLLVVDATFATPALARPLSFGADIVVHSVGKYLGGHGDVGAGVLAGGTAVVEAARAYLIRRGATMPHFEAWLALRGLRTLALRMDRHVANATAVAAFLSSAAGVRAVYHPSLSTHPQHELAGALYPHGTGGMLAFDLEGGWPEVDRFLGALRSIAIVHGLGEIATTISYPAVASHRMLSPATQSLLGLGEGTLRLSVGIENAGDIIADLARALPLAGLQQRIRA